MLVHRLTALGSFLLAAALYAASAGDRTGYDFPKGIALSLLVLSIVLTALAFKPGQPVASNEQPIPWGRIWPGLLLLIAYALLARVLGFYLSSFLAFFTLVLIYAPGRLDMRRVIWGGGVGLGFMAILYSIFSVLLKVQMPRGILL